MTGHFNIHIDDASTFIILSSPLTLPPLVILLLPFLSITHSHGYSLDLTIIHNHNPSTISRPCIPLKDHQLLSFQPNPFPTWTPILQPHWDARASVDSAFSCPVPPESSLPSLPACCPWAILQVLAYVSLQLPPLMGCSQLTKPITPAKQTSRLVHACTHAYKHSCKNHTAILRGLPLNS